jgi:hypothetical protein
VLLSVFLGCFSLFFFLPQLADSLINGITFDYLMEEDDDTPETGSIAALRMAAAVPAGSFCSLSVFLSV